MSAEGRAFTYRVIAPPMWAMVGISAGELLVVHPLLAHWTVRGAIMLSVLSLGVVGWLTYGLLSMPRLPVLVEADRLVMRAGRIKGVQIPIAQVRSLRRDWDASALKRRDVLNLALVSFPNVVVDLARPLPGRRGIIAVAHRLDDPDGFSTALERAMASRSVAASAQADPGK